MLNVLCLSERIALLLELEYGGCSFFVRWYNSTRGILAYWVVFVCQTVQLYSYDLIMLGGLCLSERIALLLGVDHVGLSSLI